MSARSRFTGGAAQIAEVITPFADVPDFLRYGSGMDKSPVERAKIKQHAPLLRQLHELSPSLSFVQGVVEKAIVLVAAECSDTIWARKLTPAEVEEWAPEISQQLRTMCRHLSQSLVKNRSWATESTSPNPAGPGPTSGPSEYFFGWDYEHRTAWRATSTGGKRELALKVFKPDGAGDEASPMAQFSSGPPVEITAITLKEMAVEA